MSRIASMLGGADSSFVPMLRLPSEEGSIVVGLGIFSRLPIREKFEKYYNGDRTRVGEMRLDMNAFQQHDLKCGVLAFCDIEKDGAVFRIGTTHFTWTPKGLPSDFQRLDLGVMLGHLQESGEFVLTGDFNAPRGGEIFGEIAARYQDNIPLHYATSLDIDLHVAGKLRPQELADKMVDGVFSTPGYQVSDVELHTGVSDHCAITAIVSKK